MIKFNPNNERIKRAYFEYQKEANKKSQSTIDNIRKAISRYELDTKYQGFESFNRHNAIAFKKALTQAKSSSGEDYLSEAKYYLLSGIYRTSLNGFHAKKTINGWT
jgi:hypothetical protein